MVVNYEPDTGGDPTGTGPAAGSAIAVSAGAALRGVVLMFSRKFEKMGI